MLFQRLVRRIGNEQIHARRREGVEPIDGVALAKHEGRLHGFCAEESVHD